MKAVTFDRYGGTEVLQYTDIEPPAPTSRQLLVRVGATSVNPVDWKVRQGYLQILTGTNFPFIASSDLAGVVEQVGESVTRFQPGDEIYTFLDPTKGGAAAEYAVVPEQRAALKPQNLSFAEAAAVPIAALTALQALRDLGDIEPGKRVLINGASGGVGTFAVQIAKTLDAHVTGVCSAANLSLVTSLGADAAIDYTQQDITKLETQYDLILDAVGKSNFWACDRILKPNGVYVSTLPTPENLGAIALTFALPGKSAKIVLAQPNSRDLAELKTWLEAGRIRVILDRTYKLEEFADAHAYSETERAVGKIAVTVGD